MGALHKGHLSLITASRKENEVTVCTLFVNPAQFNNPEDLSKYPRSKEEDLKMLESESCDIIFMPSEEEMYPPHSHIQFSMGNLEKDMEGAFRPGHFHGVAYVVSKFFNIVRPTRAYFGQKDLQQFTIIKHLNDHLFFNVELRCMPIIREENGLAMSSRNRRLSEKGKQSASLLYHSLQQARELLELGKGSEQVKQIIIESFRDTGVKLEYFEIVNAEDLSTNIEKHTPKLAVCIAAYIEDVRLIDNTLVTLRRNSSADGY